MLWTEPVTGRGTLPRSNLRKSLQALAHGLRHPASLARRLQRGLVGLYHERVLQHSPIPTVRLSDLVAPSTVTELQDCALREGNVTMPELLAIAGLVRQRRPRVLVEIGTFDGNTALQMARNAPADAVVYTLDLPERGVTPRGELDAQDGAYIADRDKLLRKYQRSEAGAKVVQWLGDSMTFDFGAALRGQRVDFAFIDGSHGYDYVASDTRKLRELLAPGGLLLWHDYTPGWPGVLEYLDELATELPLRRIDGTALVLHAAAPS
jgi:predicted O-methyltransferase YrrM